MGVQSYSNVYSYFLNVIFAPSLVCSLCRSGLHAGPWDSSQHTRSLSCTTCGWIPISVLRLCNNFCNFLHS